MPVITDTPEYQAHLVRTDAWLARKRSSPDLSPSKEWGGLPAYVAAFLSDTLTYLERRGRPVPRGALMRADRLACGHSDYQRKLVLYLTDLELKYAA